MVSLLLSENLGLKTGYYIGVISKCLYFRVSSLDGLLKEVVGLHVKKLFHAYEVET